MDELLAVASMVSVKGFFLWTVVLFFAYVVSMLLYKARERIGRSRPLYYLGYAFVVIAVVIDVAYNLTYASLLFRDLPREWTVTARLQRYRRGPLTWRWRLATFICAKLLNRWDAGHC